MRDEDDSSLDSGSLPVDAAAKRALFDDDKADEIEHASEYDEESPVSSGQEEEEEDSDAEFPSDMEVYADEDDEESQEHSPVADISEEEKEEEKKTKEEKAQ